MKDIHYPPIVHWEVTSACNHNCIHCYNYWRKNPDIIEECKKVIPVVERGSFGADMKVSLLNDGPFTIVLDSEQIC